MTSKTEVHYNESGNGRIAISGEAVLIAVSDIVIDL
jgi:hypothetical protein